jgi:hypothetical protein
MTVQEFAEELILYYNALNKTYGPLVAYHIQEKLKEIKANEENNVSDQGGADGTCPR